MFDKFVLSTLFIALVISGQTAGPGPDQGSAGACPAAQMGIVADENFAVVDLVAQSPASEAGLQMSDVLLDLTLIEIGEPFFCNDTGLPDELPPGVVRAPRDTSIYPTGPVEFSEQEAIRTLTDYGLTLRLRVLRDGEIVDLVIEPGNIYYATTPGAPTPTAIPAAPIFYFY